MAFCGQCGYLLALTMAKCPRCSASTQGTGRGEELLSDDPTILSSSNSPSQGDAHYTPLPDHQQRHSYHHMPTNPPPIQTSTPPQPAGSLYPSFPGHAPNYSSAYPSLNTPYSASALPLHTQPPRGQEGPTLHQKWALLLVLVALLLIAAATIVYLIIGPDKLMRWQGGKTITPISPTVTLTPEQQAQAVVEQHYDAINKKSYRTAYDLWAQPPQSYEDFAQGFAHTQRDEIAFGDIIRQNDMTVKVSLTVTATEDAPSGAGTQQQVYYGYYIIGQQADDSWKIITGSLTPATG